MGPDPVGSIRALAERKGPSAIIQIREKDLEARALYAFLEAALVASRPYATRIFVNGRADVARCFAPEVGIHLPEDGLPIADVRRMMPEGTPIGASAHDRAGVVRKLEAGADLVTISPVFETASKPGAPPIGLEGLQAILEHLDVERRRRVFALGGIFRANAASVIASGVGGIAAIRAAWSDPLL